MIVKITIGEEYPWLRQERILLQCKRREFDPRVRKIPWKGASQPTQVFLPGKFHGQSSLVGYRPWGPKEADTTEQLTLSLSFVGQVPAHSSK